MLGVSGFSSDFRDLSAAAAKGNGACGAGQKMFCYKVHQFIGPMQQRSAAWMRSR
jgi:acetate kinase